MAHECSKETEIALLIKDNDSMSKKLDQIDSKMDKIEDKLDTITEFILTSPQKFADKNEFDSFKNWINAKIAYVSWWAVVVATIWWYIIDKVL